MAEPAAQAEQEPSSSIPLELASIPVVDEVDRFADHPDAQYYIGVLAIPNFVEDPEGWKAARRLRANVYIDERGWLPPHAREADGGETDCDDWRSVEFGVYENSRHDNRMVGTSRLIVKGQDNALLPIETMFPEGFEDDEAELGSVEASRYVARHEDKFVQKGVSLGLIRAMSSWCVRDRKQPIYAVVEDYLTGMFDKIDLPYTQIADPKWIREYNSVNKAIVIDPVEVVDSVKAQKHTSDVMRGFFKDVYDHYGLGFLTVHSPLI